MLYAEVYNLLQPMLQAANQEDFSVDVAKVIAIYQHIAVLLVGMDMGSNTTFSRGNKRGAIECKGGFRSLIFLISHNDVIDVL